MRSNATKRKRGFTLAEVLIVVGIIVVLVAVGIIAVAAFQRGMRQLERDGIAKEIFVASQNHLTMSKSQGYLGRTDFGSEETEEGNGTGVFYFVVGSGDDPDNSLSVLNLMLPFASVDETVRLGGSYVVRYDKASAQVMDVFYCEKDGARFGHTFSAAEYDSLIENWRGSEKRGDRKNYGENKAVIGYFGGVEAQNLALGETLKAPVVTVYNAERLEVLISNPNASVAGARLQLIIEGKTTGSKKVIELIDSSTVDKSSFSVVLDSVTESGKHFADLFENFIPGEDISVTAVSYSLDSLTNIARSASKTTNSLFAAVDGDTAVISSPRHLENLAPAVSSLDKNDASGELNVTGARQITDLDWDDFLNDTNGASTTVFSAAGVPTEAGCFMPVTPGYELDYDGLSHSVTGIRVDTDGSAGLFGDLTGGSVSSLELVNFSVTSSAGSAGALCGNAVGTSVFGVLAHNDTSSSSDAALEIRGAAQTGGLAGKMTMGRIEASGAALYVRSDASDAGGLAGALISSSVTDSYSGAHTVDGAYLTDTTEGLAGRVNVIGSTGAGGLIGSASDSSVSFSYSTASASASAAGGLIGTAVRGSVENCYSVGAVSGSSVAGAYAGMLTSTEIKGVNNYFEIINDGMNALDSGTPIQFAAFDATIDSYNDFIISQGVSTHAYDPWLVFEFKGSGYLPGVEDLHGAHPVDTSRWPSFIGSHYGDWPSPETKVVNPNKLITSLDPNNAGITYVGLSYPANAGFPAGVSLIADPIVPGSAQFADYLNRSAGAAGLSVTSLTRAHILDITVADEFSEYQPVVPVEVSVLLKDSVDPSLVRVVHFGDAPELVASSVDGKVVSFEAKSFSVYAILVHQGDEEVVTPRVTFHYLSDNFTDLGNGSYSAAPYEFPNVHNELQTSQIITDGETLEGITNPPNKKNPDRYFYGWYMVNVSLGGIAADGTVTYTWDADPEQIHMGKTVSVTAPDPRVGAELTWEIDGVSDSAVIDADGSAHVYLAPIYENYYFMNFHLAAEGSEDLVNTIVCRRLIVLGSDDKATIRIGDVVAPSTDPKRLVFTGWKTNLWVDNVLEEVEIHTLDEESEEIPSSIGADGYYLDVTAKDVETTNSVDLYPIFTESRWIYFNLGKSGNGATYVPAKYLYTSEVGEENSYYLTDLPVSRRTGFIFKGWYADPSVKDLNGEWTDGTMIADANGHIVNGPYTKYDTDGVTPLYQIINGRLYVYKALSYEQGLTLYAHWEELDQTKVTILIWKQKVTDDKNAEDSEKKYDYESTTVVDPCTSGQTLGELRDNGYLGNAELQTYTGFHYRTTEMTSRTVAGDGTTVVNVYYDRDLMTINFYSDSTLPGGVSASTYVATTSSYSALPEQYGIVGGRYIRLSYREGSGYDYSIRYSYVPTASDSGTQYALVNTETGNGEYVQITRGAVPVENVRWRYYTGMFMTQHYVDEGRTNGIFYVYDSEHSGYQRQGRRWVWVDVYNPSGYTADNTPDRNDTTQYYCLYNNRYYELDPVVTTTTVYTWKLGDQVWEGIRYRRVSSGTDFTGTRYTATGSVGSRVFSEYTGTDGTRDQYALDSRGGHVELTATRSSADIWYYTEFADHYYPDPANDGQNGKTVYGLIDGQYVELTPVLGDGYVYRAENTYVPTAAVHDDEPVQYAVVDGEYVQLQYVAIGTRSGYTVNAVYSPVTGTPNANGEYYGIYNSDFVPIYYRASNGRWYRSYSTYGGYNYRYTDTRRYTMSEYSGIITEGATYRLNGSNQFIASDSTYYQLYCLDGDVVYELGPRDTVAIYGWSLDGSTEYTGARYLMEDGGEYTGTRLERGTETAAPYTYTPVSSDDHEGEQYMLDANGGHVKLIRSREILSYEFNEEPYTGTRYSNGPIETEVIYTGTRYERRNANYDNMLTWTGLYGQTFAKNGYKWEDVSFLNWREQPNGGTGQTLLDGFTQVDNPYNLYSNGNSTNYYLYHYKQQLDGTYSETERYTARMSSNSANFNFSNKFDGFTVDSYSTSQSGYYGTTAEFSPNGGNNSTYPGASASIRTPTHVYHTRNSYTLTFNVNYPNLADVTFTNGQSGNASYSVLFEMPLTQYGKTGADYFVPTAPDNYVFAGWYEDDIWLYNKSNDEGRDFDFSQTMPSANKILYAKWQPVKFRIRIDPNGGIIDHIDHNDPASFRYDNSGYRTDQATFFNANYNEEIGEYSVVREYVEITSVEANTLPANEVFYYMNAQYYPETDLGGDARNALYLTEAELEPYYQYYRSKVEAGTVLGFEAWKNNYLAKDESGGFQLYRHTRDGENYVNLGWYEVLDYGTENERLDAMPYNFSNPTKSEVILRAVWRLDGGYSIQYTPEYVMDDGTIINGFMPAWNDPQIIGSKYADNAVTTVYRQPTDVTVNGQPIEEDEYLFLGWRLVSLSTVNGNLTYIPLENGVYYDPSDFFTVHARFADANMIIHMQAVYEERDKFSHRPLVTDLVLDANDDFYAGASVDETKGDLPEWDGVGTVTPDYASEQIKFSTIQSSTPVRLSQYATPFTKDDTSSLCGYFKYDKGYLLLGFDDDADPRLNNYLPDYPADGLISIRRSESGIAYAVWEPLVYLTFVNNTKNDAQGLPGGPVTFGLSSDDGEALYVVNIKKGMYAREAMSDIGSITVEEGETLVLAIPYGKDKNVTVTGTNSLGTGVLLQVESSLDGTQRSYTTAKNGKTFTVDETLVEHEEGIVVTFTAELADRTIVFKDNTNRDGTGGATDEFYYKYTDTVSDPMPRRGRVGSEFLGWAHSPTATSADYEMDSVINDLPAFFETYAVDEIVTLYGVWKSDAEVAHLKVYKEVDGPGNTSASNNFTFRVRLAGTAKRYSSSSNETIDGYRDYTLAHGQYLHIIEKQFADGSNGYVRVSLTVQKYQIGENGAADTPIGSSDVLSWSSSHSGQYVNVNPNVTVTETGTSMAAVGLDKYFTSVEVAPGAIIPSGTAISPDNAQRNVFWDNPANSGGTVIFTNDRKTADITVKKELVNDVFNPIKAFNFTVSLTLPGGENYTLPSSAFSVSNGTAGQTITGVPTGSVLVITEAKDPAYDTVATSASGSFDPAANSYTLTVSSDAEVIFTNTMKKQLVRIVKEGSEGETNVEASFDLVGGTRTFLNQKYTTPDNNVVYEGELYYNTYTLTERWVQPGYRQLEAPSTLTVSDAGVTVSGASGVSVTGPDGSGYYTVKVVNQKTAVVTVTKELVDAFTPNRTFGFTLSATFKGESLNLGSNAAFSLTNGATRTLTLPIGTVFTVTELVNSDYDTTVKVGSDPAESVNTKTFTVNGDTEVVVRNVRKVADVTVKKALKDVETTEAFKFRLRLVDTYNQALALTGITDSTGIGLFTLSEGQEFLIPGIPLGTTVTVEEYDADAYSAIISMSAHSNLSTRNNTASLKLTADDVVVFTNTIAGRDLSFMKIDGKGDAVSGAEFTLYTDQDCTAILKINGADAVATSDAGGKVTFEGVVFGVYYMKETVTPAGYVENTAVYKVTVTKDSVTIVPISGGVEGDAILKVLNESEVSRKVILKKVNEIYDALPAAGFDILRYDMSVVASGLTSSDNGAFWIGRLPLGIYYIRETVAPSGYKTPASEEMFKLIVEADKATFVGLVTVPET